MKITVENIVREYPKISTPLPAPLAQDKFEKLKTTFLPNYEKSDVIKNMVDTFVEKLNMVVATSQPEPKAEKAKVVPTQKRKQVVSKKSQSVSQLRKTVSKASKAVTRESQSVSKPQKPELKTSKEQTGQKKCDAVNVEHFSEDVRLIRRFNGCVGKERPRRTLLAIYRDFDRRITERKVSRTSKHAGLVFSCSKKLAALLEIVAKEKLTHVTVEVDKEFQDKVNQASNEVSIRTSVNLLKRFVGIEGETKPDKTKVGRIIIAFKSALEAKKITKEDFYAKEVGLAYVAMQNYMDGKVDYIALEPTTLSGIDKYFGLGKPVATMPTGDHSGRVRKKSRKKAKTTVVRTVVYQEPKIETSRFQVDIAKPEPTTNIISAQEPEKVEVLSGLFSPITYQPAESSHEKTVLPGDLGKFLGYVERYEYAILLRGEKGAGKTRMLYQLMNTFARAGFTVGSFSLEIGKQSNLIADMRNQYISPLCANKVFIADSVPNGLEDVKKAAKQFDVVCIDSWGKIPGTKPDDFDKLRKEFPKTMFIVIFQSTTNGTARGGSMPEYDAGIVIQVAEGGRAYCEKNRYNGEDLTFLVFQRKLRELESQIL
jgi:hypothetical protein